VWRGQAKAQRSDFLLCCIDRKRKAYSFFWRVNFKTPFFGHGSNPMRGNGQPFLVDFVKIKRINCDHKKRRKSGEGLDLPRIGLK
jgi:hypothetical protein